MSDDDRNVSAREWRAVREGEPHAAPRTSPNNTPESFIVGVGASGALLAGAAIVFVTLVGLVSFNVWPKAQDATTGANVELSAATPRVPAGSTVVPVSAAAGQLAAVNVGTPVSTGGGNGGGNGGSGGKGGNGGNGKPNPPAPPSTTPTTPGDGGSTDGGSTGSGGPVTAIKNPSQEVTPTHPSHPHQGASTGEKGKDPGDSSGGDSTGVIGKPPIARPPAVAINIPSTGPTTPSTGPPSPPSDDDDQPPSDSGGGHGDSGDGHGCSHSHDHGHHH
jgi:hypothetical protein